MPTTILSSQFVTQNHWVPSNPKFERCLNVTQKLSDQPKVAAATGTKLLTPVTNLKIADPAVPLGSLKEVVKAVAFAGARTLTSTGFYQASPTVSYQGTYLSDNQASGVSFFVFSKNKFVSGVDLNVGPNSTGAADGSDSIYISTGTSSSDSVTFTNNTITTGDSTSLKGDLVAFGVLGSGAGDDDDDEGGVDSYRAFSGTSNTGSVFSARFEGFTAPGAGRLIVRGTTVNTGDGRDSVIFANLAGEIGSNASSQVNNFNLGKGADLFYLKTPSVVFGRNVIDLGDDSDADSIVFGAGSFTRLTGAADPTLNPLGSALYVKNFKAGDNFVFNNTSYTDQNAITTAFGGSKIYFI